MLLYHGTTEAVAKAALIEGLLPRCKSGVMSRWTEHPSSPDHVYLTETYAGYFAMQAAKEGGRWGLVEVDVDRLPLSCLVPDEDFLEQCSRGQTWPDDETFAGIRAARDITERTAWFRENLYRFSGMWPKSIEMLGNCAVEGGVPTSAVTRVALFDPKLNRSPKLT